MEIKFLHNTNFDFIGMRKPFFAISALLIIAGIVSLIVRGGPNYGIDFSGGTLLQVAFDKPVAMNQVRAAFASSGIGNIELQSTQGSQHNSIIIRTKISDISQDEFAAKVSAVLKQQFPERTATIERTEFVGPSVGKHLVKQAMFALFFSFIGIIIYVAFRFHSGIWGVAGVLGIMHDVFIVFGIFSLFNMEITLTIIAAFLTIAGFSINDTIVLFDRIRENMKLIVKEGFGSIINKSINQTLSRTIITSLTVFIVSLILFFMGGEVLHDFAFAMVVGTIVGVYSSIFVCSPLIFEWELYKKRKSSSAAAAKSSKYIRTV